MGRNRAEVAVEKLTELNSYVTVRCTSEEISETFLQTNKINVSDR